MSNNNEMLSATEKLRSHFKGHIDLSRTEGLAAVRALRRERDLLTDYIRDRKMLSVDEENRVLSILEANES